MREEKSEKIDAEENEIKLTGKVCGKIDGE